MHDNIQIILELVLKSEPELTPYGFDAFKSRSSLQAVYGETREEYNSRIAEARSKFDLKAFAAALNFCRKRLTKSKTINRKIGSYGLKHIVEKACHCYLANGTFIAAAIAAGFSYKRYDDGPNCAFNISHESIQKVVGTADINRLAG